MAEWAFIEHVTDSISRPRTGDPKHPTQWPSEATAIVETDDGRKKIVGKCRRASFFRLLIDSYRFYEHYAHWRLLVERLEREQSPPERYMQWIWKQGELYEQYLVDEAKNSGVFVDAQARIYVRSHNVSGSIDIEVLNPRTGKYSIVESKSVYGFGSDSVLGSQYDRNQGRMGEPKDSNLMQIGLYHWWKASRDPAYEESRLVYGSRDTGRYGEYLVRTVEEDGRIFIEYKPHAPYTGRWVRPGITINSILDCYAYIQRCIDSGVIPDRDFNITYSDEQIREMFEKDMLNKTDTETMAKKYARDQYNAWVSGIESLGDDDLLGEALQFTDELPKAIVDLLNDMQTMSLTEKQTVKLVKLLRKLEPKRELKGIKKGDWQCNFCQHKNVCYTPEGEPREV